MKIQRCKLRVKQRSRSLLRNNLRSNLRSRLYRTLPRMLAESLASALRLPMGDAAEKDQSPPRPESLTREEEPVTAGHRN